MENGESGSIPLIESIWLKHSPDSLCELVCRVTSPGNIRIQHDGVQSYTGFQVAHAHLPFLNHSLPSLAIVATAENSSCLRLSSCRLKTA